MAHGIYYFLLNLAVADDATNEEIRDEACSAFASFVDSSCDENNWHEKIFVALKDGRRSTFPDNDETHPQEDEYRVKSYEELYDAAVDEVVYELLDSIPALQLSLMDRQAKMVLAAEEGAAQVSAAFKSLADHCKIDAAAGPDPASGTAVRRNYSNYLRNRVATQVNLLAESLFECSHPPFVSSYSDRTPYDYSAFNLVIEGEPNAILVVDIHT